MTRVRAVLSIGVLVLAGAWAGGYLGVKVGTRYQFNKLCCDIPRNRNIPLSFREALGLVTFPSQIGQDKWVLEAVFPGVANGFFLDVGSADGTLLSNTKALEARGWTGICVDPFPTNMQDRTCQLFKDVVYSEAGHRMQFKAAGEVGGIADTLGRWKDAASQAPTVELTTVTLADILQRAQAPRFIHFISLDIEGGELEALKAFPFAQHEIGALAIEHNFEEPKRSNIESLLKSRGYERVHIWFQDDYYRPRRR